LSEPVDRPSVGLRERKKARTRAEIQGHALRLFHQQGYEATTVAQIIEEAEVSESTFFRYFPTKADVVLFDGMDALIVEAFRDQPHELGEIHALRVALQTVFGRLSPKKPPTSESAWISSSRFASCERPCWSNSSPPWSSFAKSLPNGPDANQTTWPCDPSPVP
jgi:AcrR family transcriptional regulator